MLSSVEFRRRIWEAFSEEFCVKKPLCVEKAFGNAVLISPAVKHKVVKIKQDSGITSKIVQLNDLKGKLLE